MGKQGQYRRLLWLALLLALAFAGLGYRLLDLQVLRHDELAVKAEEDTRRELLLQPRRGDILDIKGNPLASSAYAKIICADPAQMANHQAEVAHALAPLLGLSESALVQTLRPLGRDKNGRTVTNRYVRLKRAVPPETWEQIKAAMTNLSFGVDERKLREPERLLYRGVRKSVYPEDEQLRVYPNKTLAAHVVGYTTTFEREINGRPVSEISGRDGIEATFNEKLAGVCGWRIIERDGRGRELVALREQDVEPHDGLNVVLTIDSFIQDQLERILAEAAAKHTPISISGIVVRPRTGEILAMATLPNFDPNNRTRDLAALRNRVITDIAEPGSTFKVVVVSGALNDGAVNLNEPFDCEHGHWFYGGRWLGDHESLGVLSVEQIITKSSNIGAAKVGLRLGQARLYDYIRAFGFGTPTGIPLPGEVFGIVRDLKNWKKIASAQIPMGQGISVTSLQMIMAMSAVANNGWLMRPMLVDRLEDQDRSVVAKYYPQRVRRVIGEPAVKSMVQALKTVTSPEGTGAKGALEHYTVAGKTGTAWKVENGHYVRKYYSSFIGFFPADNPQICISVNLDEPKREQGYYGGQVAAPIFKQIAEVVANYLNIPPDITESIVATSEVRPASPPVVRAQ